MALSLTKSPLMVSMIESSFQTLLVSGSCTSTNLTTRSFSTDIAAILMTSITTVVNDKHVAASGASFESSYGLFFHVRSGKRTKLGPRGFMMRWCRSSALATRSEGSGGQTWAFILLCRSHLTRSRKSPRLSKFATSSNSVSNLYGFEGELTRKR